MKYFPFHLQMLQDIEEAQPQRCQTDPKPSTHPTKRWLREAVNEIALSERLKLSDTARKKAMAELKRVILQNDKDGRCQLKHKALKTSFVSVASFLVAIGFS